MTRKRKFRLPHEPEYDNLGRRIRLKHSPELLICIAGEQGWRCCYCGTRLNEHDGKVWISRATFEHVIPFSLGGADDYSNLVAACEPCNFTRDNNP